MEQGRFQKSNKEDNKLHILQEQIEAKKREREAEEQQTKEGDDRAERRAVAKAHKMEESFKWQQRQQWQQLSPQRLPHRSLPNQQPFQENQTSRNFGTRSTNKNDGAGGDFNSVVDLAVDPGRAANELPRTPDSRWPSKSTGDERWVRKHNAMLKGRQPQNLENRQQTEEDGRELEARQQALGRANGHWGQARYYAYAEYERGWQMGEVHNKQEEDRMEVGARQQTSGRAEKHDGVDDVILEEPPLVSSRGLGHWQELTKHWPSLPDHQSETSRGGESEVTAEQLPEKQPKGSTNVPHSDIFQMPFEASSASPSGVTEHESRDLHPGQAAYGDENQKPIGPTSEYQFMDELKSLEAHVNFHFERPADLGRANQVHSYFDDNGSGMVFAAPGGDFARRGDAASIEDIQSLWKLPIRPLDGYSKIDGYSSTCERRSGTVKRGARLIQQPASASVVQDAPESLGYLPMAARDMQDALDISFGFGESSGILSPSQPTNGLMDRGDSFKEPDRNNKSMSGSLRVLENRLLFEDGSVEVLDVLDDLANGPENRKASNVSIPQRNDEIKVSSKDLKIEHGNSDGNGGRSSLSDELEDIDLDIDAVAARNARRLQGLIALEAGYTHENIPGQFYPSETVLDDSGGGGSELIACAEHVMVTGGP